VAAALIARLGVTRGDRVALMAASSLEWAVCDLGIALAGAVSVPIYPSSTPEQAAFILQDSGAAWRSSATRATSSACGAWPIRGGPPVRRPRSAPDGDDLAFEQLQLAGEAALESQRPTLAALVAELGLADPFTIVYTSGTTGLPRGVVLSHKNLVYEAWAIKNVIAADRSDEQLMILPLAHVFARHLLWGAVEQGAVTAFVPAGPERAARPSTSAFQEVAPTSWARCPACSTEFYARILGDVQRGNLGPRAAFERCMRSAARSASAASAARRSRAGSRSR
jgi:long-chain acyl-CoA synthetase